MGPLVTRRRYRGKTMGNEREDEDENMMTMLMSMHKKQHQL